MGTRNFMNDVAQCCSTAQTGADVLYIGYPKAASTFVGRFLERHPEVTADHDLLTPLLWGPADFTAAAATQKRCPNKIYVSVDEMVALSICGITEEKWKSCRLVPDAWDEVKDEIVLDPVVA